MKLRFSINLWSTIGVMLALIFSAVAEPPAAFASPQIVVSPGSLAVTNALGGATNVTLTISNALTAASNLTFGIFASETGRSTFSWIVSNIELQPADHDFTKAAPGKEFAADHLLVRFASGMQGAQRMQTLTALGDAQIQQEYNIVPGLAGSSCRRD